MSKGWTEERRRRQSEMARRLHAEGKLGTREHARMGAEARWGKDGDLRSRAQEAVIRTALDAMSPHQPGYVRIRGAELAASVLGLRGVSPAPGIDPGEARKKLIVAAMRARDRARDGEATDADVELLRRLKDGHEARNEAA